METILLAVGEALLTSEGGGHVDAMLVILVMGGVIWWKIKQVNQLHKEKLEMAQAAGTPAEVIKKIGELEGRINVLIEKNDELIEENKELMANNASLVAQYKDLVNKYEALVSKMTGAGIQQ